MMADNDIQIIHRTDSDQLAFAAAITDQTLIAHLVALCNLDIFLSRNAKEYDISRQGSRDLRIGQRDGRADHAGRLRMMAAAMRRAGLGVGVGVRRNGQTIEFAHQTDGGTVRVIL